MCNSCPRPYLVLGFNLNLKLQPTSFSGVAISNRCLPGSKAQTHIAKQSDEGYRAKIKIIYFDTHTHLWGAFQQQVACIGRSDFTDVKPGIQTFADAIQHSEGAHDKGEGGRKPVRRHACVCVYVSCFCCKIRVQSIEARIWRDVCKVNKCV